MWRQLSCILILSSLTACRATTPLDNGGAVTPFRLGAGDTRTFHMDLPADLEGAMVQTSSVPGLHLEVLSPDGHRVASCEAPHPCILSQPPSGRFRVDVHSRDGADNIVLSAVWVGVGVESWREGMPLELPTTPAGGIHLASLRVPDTGSLTIAAPVMLVGDLDVEVLALNGEVKAACEATEGCLLSEAGPHILRYKTRLGHAATRAIRSPQRLNIEGVWFVTQAQFHWSWWRELLLSMISLLRLEMASFGIGLESFQFEFHELFQDWWSHMDDANRRFVEIMKRVVAPMVSAGVMTLDSLESTVRKWPDIIDLPLSAACQQARAGAPYLEFRHDPVARRYTLIEGQTGEGVARRDGACTWMALEDLRFSHPSPSGAMVDAGWLSAVLSDDDMRSDVHILSPRQFALRMTSGLMPGTLATFTRLACDAGSLGAALFDFVVVLEGGVRTRAYVPDAEGSQSGVTVAAGFDLGARNVQDLERLGLDATVIHLFRPYLGLKGVTAERYLREHPLTISAAQAEDIHVRVKQQSLDQLIARYDASSALSYCSIPDAWKTVIASVAFQYGVLPDRTPQFWQAVRTQQWRDAIAILRDFKDSYPTRRHQEADYVERNS